MTIGLGDEIFWVCPSLESNPVDLSPSARTLTLSNGAAIVNDTNQGGSKAYEFDGSDDEITTTTVFTALRELSWSAWIYDNNPLNEAGTTLFGQWTYANGGTYQVSIGLGSIHQNPRAYTPRIAGVLDGGGFVNTLLQTGSVQTLPDSVAAGWQHWAFTWNNTSSSFYINGIHVNTSPANAGALTETNGFFKFSGSWAGRIDDFRGYDRPLSESDIEHLASARGVLGEPGGGHINRTLLGVG